MIYLLFHRSRRLRMIDAADPPAVGGLIDTASQGGVLAAGQAAAGVEDVRGP